MSAWAGDWAEWRRELAAAALLGLFLGAIGPFGTWSNSGFGIRLAYWVGIMVVGVVVYGFGMRLALYWGERWRQPVWFVLPLSVLAISLPMSLLTSTVVLTLWPVVRSHMRPFDWYGQAVVMGLPLAAAALWSRRAFPVLAPAAPEPAASEPPPSEPPPSEPPPSEPMGEAAGARLLQRLPPRLGRTLLCLQMEDHYVRAHTARGSELVLMPLRDAMAEAAGIEGMQVHRSWWVARAAVSQPVQRGRNLVLVLTNGIEAPVSRSFVSALRAEGWLDSVSAH